MRVLLIILSEEDAHDGKALPLGIFAGIYYAFRDSSVELVLASRQGGYLFLDLQADSASGDDGVSQRFRDDRAARDEISDTVCYDLVHAEDFDAAMCLAPLEDDVARPLPERAQLLVNSLLLLGKPVAVFPETLAPASGNGLLITGGNARVSVDAANALLGIIRSARPRNDTASR